jgi:heavy metal efflux system protein
MISKIVQFALKRRLFIVLATAVIAVLGLVAYKRLNTDVFPDASPALVQIFTEAEGMAPEEVEQLISYSIESSMFGLPRIKNIRSFSTFALSIVSVYFEDKTDIYWARELVSQRLLEIRRQLPVQAEQPVLGPISTGLGMVYVYYLEGGDTPLMELRTLQDWVVKYQIKAIPQITEVKSIGGDVKQYQVHIDPQLLLKYDLTLSGVLKNIRDGNQNAGASFITKGQEEYIVRSVGLIQSLDELKTTVLASHDGTPVLLKDVARVETGPAVRRGAALANGGDEKVVGLVLKLYGANTAEIITAMERKIGDINKSLPAGVKIVPFYNQASFIEQCHQTVTVNLVTGIALVIIVLFIFLGNFSMAFIPVMSLPFSILFAFLVMQRTHLPADLMSIGGAAIGVGLIGDASIIIAENAYRHVQEGKRDRLAAILAAGVEVGRPVFIAIAIIILVFLPIFTLQGMEGVMFRPMGYVITYTLAGSLVFALVASPALASFLMHKRRRADREPGLMRLIRKGYLRTFLAAQKRPVVVFLITGIILVVGIGLVPKLGREFIPSLDEGTMMLEANFDPNISLKETIDRAATIEKELMSFPEISGVLTRIGRGEAGTHAHFVNNAFTMIQLKPLRKWKNYADKDELIEAIEHKLQPMPGLNLNFTQPIAHNIDELITGSKAQLAVKIYGHDFNILTDLSARTRGILSSIKGAANVQVEPFTGQNQIRIALRRDVIGRYGLTVDEVQKTVEAAVGGIAVGEIFEEQKRFDIFVRFREEDRKGIDDLGNLLISLPEGGRVPLDLLASIEEVIGPRLISRENNNRYITVQGNVRKRDIGSFVDEARNRVEKEIALPPGYTITWGGQFELQQKANRRLLLITPITFALVLLLLYLGSNSLRDILIMLINIPLSLTGGIIALKLSGQYLSVPASIGFISILGICLEDGLVLIAHFRDLLAEGLGLKEAIVEGVGMKVRPVLMTQFTAIFGVLPLVLSGGAGAEIQRPLATVVVGGLITSTFVTLFVLPLVYQYLRRTK